jgi:hypothetical protein
MATATTRSLLAAAAGVALITAAGCGSSAQGSAGTRPSRRPASATLPTRPWAPLGLHGAAAPPAGWRLARSGDGAALAYPPGWRALGGDRGTLSAALRDAGGGYLGYLNLTPRQGAERPSNWPAFRTAHNRGEGDRQVRLLAVARGLRLRSGSATCVQDAYLTSIGSRYIELACLIEGAHPAVVLGAAPPSRWHSEAPTIARAISSAVL